MEGFSEKERRIYNVNMFIANNLWKIIVSGKDSKTKLREMVEELASFFNVERCSLMLKDNKEFFCIFASKGLPSKIVKETRIKEGEGIAGLAIKEKKAIFMKKVGILVNKKDYASYQSDNLISYPIEIDKEIIGVLNITDKRDDLSLTEKDVESIKPILDRIKFVLKDLREGV
ncbi:MAG: GAF domain-containing protein [Nanoarchaeota archaeon]|nr:GAF domain-containing protein [Nanoarchaeota archaeon]